MAVPAKPTAPSTGNTERLQWDTTAATITEPAAGQQATGYVAIQKPPVGHWNYWWMKLGKWIARVDVAWFYRDVDPVTLRPLVASFDELNNGAQNDGVDQAVEGASWVHGSDSTENRTTVATPSRGAARVFFDKAKAAFRAGFASGAQFDDVNRGESSAAFGEGCKAVGKRSFAAGVGCVAGDVANPNDPIIGSAAISVGANCLARAAGSIAVGGSCQALEVDSVAGGSSCTTNGIGSVALGHSCQASGDGSAAIGDSCTTSAAASKSLAAGDSSSTTATGSIALGVSCAAGSPGGVAAGESCSTTGAQIGCVAVGKASTCSGEGSVSAGWGNTSSGFGCFVSGRLGDDNGVNYRSVHGGGHLAGSLVPIQTWMENKGGIVQNGAVTLNLDFIFKVSRAYSVLVHFLSHRETGGLATNISKTHFAVRVDGAGGITSDGAVTWVSEHGTWALGGANPTVTLNPVANDRTIRFAVTQAVANDVVDVGCRVEVVEIGRGV